MYIKEEEKTFMLHVVRELSKDHVKFNQQQNFERAISLAQDEIQEFEALFTKFVNDVSHLEVFQYSIKEPLTRDITKMVSNISYLVNKSYSQEEKDSMPEEVLNNVRATQQKRYELLKNIAQRYIARPSTTD